MKISELAILCFFPGLLIGKTANQQVWSVSLLIIGQVFFWANYSAAAIIAYTTFRKKLWILLFIACMFVSKVGRFVLGDGSIFFILYTISLSLLFCASGAAVAIRWPKLVYKQAMLFCYISVPVMILQIIGVEEFHILHNMASESIMHPSLFVGEADAYINIQARPAGILFASVFQSIVIMFALGLHYGQINTKKIKFNDVIICAMVVLSMAKIVFLTFGVIAIWLLVVGKVSLKIRVMKNIIIFSFLMFLYSYFFPGFFHYNTSVKLFHSNFVVRLFDLSMSIESDMLKSFFFEYIVKQPYSLKVGNGHQSGYATIAKSLPYIITAGFFILPVYFKGLKKLNCDFPELVNLSTISMLILILMPLITSFIGGPVFSFIAGFALLPLVILNKTISPKIKSEVEN